MPAAYLDKLFMSIFSGWYSHRFFSSHFWTDVLAAFSTSVRLISKIREIIFWSDLKSLIWRNPADSGSHCLLGEQRAYKWSSLGRLPAIFFQFSHWQIRHVERKRRREKERVLGMKRGLVKRRSYSFTVKVISIIFLSVASSSYFIYQ